LESRLMAPTELLGSPSSIDMLRKPVRGVDPLICGAITKETDSIMAHRTRYIDFDFIISVNERGVICQVNYCCMK